MKQINTQMRGTGLFGPMALKLFLSARPGQPLVLLREPENPADRNAVICCDAHGVSMGYVARQAAAVIAPDMDQGFLWRAKVTGMPQRRRSCIRIKLWREEPGSMETIMAMNERKEKVS